MIWQTAETGSDIANDNEDLYSQMQKVIATILAAVAAGLLTVEEAQEQINELLQSVVNAAREVGRYEGETGEYED